MKMGETTGIAWTHSTFNPWWGCTRVSPGCGQGDSECYAQTFDRRVHPNDVHWGPKSPRKFFGDKYWAQPLKWNEEAARAGERRRVFCGSMCDVCEDRDDLIPHRARLALTIQNTPDLDWLLLTKRPENFVRLFGEYWPDEWPANVWAGCTVEDQEYAYKRHPQLAAVPARVRFYSVEPMLGPIHDLPLAGIDWVIVGGQSGPGATPMHPAWAESVVQQTHAAGARAFFKQWGEWHHDRSLVANQRVVTSRLVYENGDTGAALPMYYVGKKRLDKLGQGDLLDGVRVQEFPDSPAAMPAPGRLMGLLVIEDPALSKGPAVLDGMNYSAYEKVPAPPGPRGAENMRPIEGYPEESPSHD